MTSMDYRSTRHQVARTARPDAEASGKLYLIKNVRHLRATYQIRLLAVLAAESGRRLVLKVPADCRYSPSLRELVKASGVIRREAL